jgi:hypothetical protein
LEIGANGKSGLNPKIAINHEEHEEHEGHREKKCTEAL